MRSNVLHIAALILSPSLAFTVLSGCGKEKSGSPPAAANDEHGHDHADADAHDDHDHADAHDEHGHEHADGDARSHGHGGRVIELGTQTIGSFTAVATRDQGEIVAGKDAPIDVTVTAATGSQVEVTALRLWIGTEDARGSVKAKAEIEDPHDPNRWHTHAEIPSPVPAGSKLWVEIEDDKGGKSVGSFDLKM